MLFLDSKRENHFEKHKFSLLTVTMGWQLFSLFLKKRPTNQNNS